MSVAIRDFLGTIKGKQKILLSFSFCFAKHTT